MELAGGGTLNAIESIGRQMGANHPALALLVLHGSRATGGEHPGSDWDFAFLGDPGIEPDRLHADLVRALDGDRVDLANLATASGLLRYRAARDGFVAHERAPGTFRSFWLDAVHFWCDMGPVIRAGNARTLERLP